MDPVLGQAQEQAVVGQEPVVVASVVCCLPGCCLVYTWAWALLLVGPVQVGLVMVIPAPAVVLRHCLGLWAQCCQGLVLGLAVAVQEWAPRPPLPPSRVVPPLLPLPRLASSSAVTVVRTSVPVRSCSIKQPVCATTASAACAQQCCM